MITTNQAGYHEALSGLMSQSTDELTAMAAVGMADAIASRQSSEKSIGHTLATIAALNGVVSVAIIADVLKDRADTGDTAAKSAIEAMGALAALDRTTQTKPESKSAEFQVDLSRN